jgi:hypothetical protein
MSLDIPTCDLNGHDPLPPFGSQRKNFAAAPTEPLGPEGREGRDGSLLTSEIAPSNSDLFYGE